MTNAKTIALLYIVIWQKPVQLMSVKRCCLQLRSFMLLLALYLLNQRSSAPSQDMAIYIYIYLVMCMKMVCVCIDVQQIFRHIQLSICAYDAWTVVFCTQNAIMKYNGAYMNMSCSRYNKYKRKQWEKQQRQ